MKKSAKIIMMTLSIIFLAFFSSYANETLIKVTGILHWGDPVGKINDFEIDDYGNVLLQYCIKESGQLYQLRLNYKSELRKQIVYYAKQQTPVTIYGTLDKIYGTNKVLVREDGCKFIEVEKVVPIENKQTEIITKIGKITETGDGIIFYTKKKSYYVYLHNEKSKLLTDNMQKAYKFKIPVIIITDRTQGDNYVIEIQLTNTNLNRLP
ncbi:MAG TPA: hypothetical protein PK160_01920 [Bacillota bacterium]|nr:hypothetical protein [Bacillota bacterium]